jgi:hypothetical protein
MVENGFCKGHSGLEKGQDDLERRIDRAERDHFDIYNQLRGKVSNAFFIMLCGLVIGGLGFQWRTYESMKRVEIKTAVIEAIIMERSTIPCQKSPVKSPPTKPVFNYPGAP